MDKASIPNELILESPLLKLPHELLRTNLKAQQKLVEKEISMCLAAAGQMEFSYSQDDNSFKISDMIERLKLLRRKISIFQNEEEQHISRSRARLHHMQQLLTPSTPFETVSYAGGQRLHRLIVEFMLRQGLSDSAKKLSTFNGIDKLLDLDVYIQSGRIVVALLSHSTNECIAWCNDHKTGLRRNKNTLEFELRRQEFIELVRRNQIVDAIAFAQRNLAPHRVFQQKEVDQVCALLCYKEGTTTEPYKTLYSSDRWQMLANLFTQTHQDLYNIPPISPFEVALSAGLSALKTPTCYNEHDKHLSRCLSTTCPICSPEFNDLARGVPFAHSVRSHLVDVISGDAMDDENVPIVLPSGRVYGARSLQTWNDQNGTPENHVQDPQTGESFPTRSLRKAFVL